MTRLQRDAYVDFLSAKQRVPISTSLGYRLHKFAETFPGPEGTSRIRELDGKVAWDSMMRILHVEDRGKRDAILERVAAGQLSTRAVRG